MEKGTVIYVEYVTYDPIEKQGKRSSIEKYLKQGYHIHLHRNGYWVLTKPAEVNVTVKISSGAQEIDMKEAITDFYGKDKISKSLVEKFEKAIQKDKINIYMDAGGYYDIRENKEYKKTSA